MSNGIFTNSIAEIKKYTLAGTQTQIIHVLVADYLAHVYQAT